MDSTFVILERIAQNADWPTTQSWTQVLNRDFQASLDLLDGYRSDPETLYRAMNQFIVMPNGCYGQAGAAAVLLAASQFEKSMSEEVAAAISHWIEAAKGVNDSIPAVRAIEIDFLVRGEQMELAASKLKELIKVNPEDYWACRCALNYWAAMGDLAQVAIWGKRAEESAHSSRRWEQVIWQMGVIAHQQKLWQQAAGFYEQLISASSSDAALYHNMSEVYFELGEYKKALAYNKKSLQFKSTATGEQLQKKILKASVWWRKLLP
ncbi:tetratricopeptide repeat protein [Motilimonas cestriensis]|uniref:Tetratricopeptide repeat protein n=1 Tax=Motilimonas cestriensis TaxID=2742685 RepID=A0ABS8WD14_9GAMM|nr:tetratricopeptide repeat protein [Motilimonas cestriensis]MCE2596934.1 tetratricopeptide repeat protein [Motilimonas cestriensis]